MSGTVASAGAVPLAFEDEHRALSAEPPAGLRPGGFGDLVGQQEVVPRRLVRTVVLRTHAEEVSIAPPVERKAFPAEAPVGLMERVRFDRAMRNPDDDPG